MEPVYEADFEPCSHRLRPGRSAHDAVDALWKGVMAKKRWVIDADVSKFLDQVKSMGNGMDLKRLTYKAQIWDNGLPSGARS